MTPEYSHFAIFGHRGSPRRAAENTIASFDLALSEGADGFETDVRTLADGTLLLFHDHEVNGRPVESFGLEELAAGCQGVITDCPGEAALWRRGAR